MAPLALTTLTLRLQLLNLLMLLSRNLHVWDDVFAVRRGHLGDVGFLHGNRRILYALHS